MLSNGSMIDSSLKAIKLLVLHTVPCTVFFPLLVVFLLLWFVQFVILLLPLALSVCIFLFGCVLQYQFCQTAGGD